MPCLVPPRMPPASLDPTAMSREAAGMEAVETTDPAELHDERRVRTAAMATLAEFDRRRQCTAGTGAAVARPREIHSPQVQ